MAPEVEIPGAWKNGDKQEALVRTDELTYLNDWWEVFDDIELEALEKRAVENNRDLYIAYERIQESRALMSVAAADFYPQLTLNPLYTNTSQLIKSLGSSAGNNIFRAHQLLYYLPVNLNYEVDLWGKIQSGYQAATYNWLAQQKDYEMVMLNLTTLLATSYYQLRSADSQLLLLAQVVEVRNKAFQINSDRYEAQIINYSDVSLAGQELESARLQYEEVLRQREVLENQIAVLIGAPASDFNLAAHPLTSFPPVIPEGIPSEVLLRRPDLAQAEYTTQAVHYQVKAAYADYFPSLNLTAAAGFESPVLRDFLKGISRYWMNGVGVDQLLFDGGRTTGYVDMQIARFKQASGTYQQLALQAFQEVENSLNDIESYVKQYELSVSAVSWADKSFNLFKDRYLLGVVNYIDVANTERELLRYQILQNDLQGFRFLSTIQFIKSLGGGWGPVCK